MKTFEQALNEAGQKHNLKFTVEDIDHVTVLGNDSAGVSLMLIENTYTAWYLANHTIELIDTSFGEEFDETTCDYLRTRIYQSNHAGDPRIFTLDKRTNKPVRFRLLVGMPQDSDFYIPLFGEEWWGNSKMTWKQAEKLVFEAIVRTKSWTVSTKFPL